MLLTGTIGTGKTALGQDIGEVLSERGMAAAIVDLDWLGWVTVEPSGSTYYDLILANLKAIWPNLMAAGARYYVLTRALTQAEELARLRSVVPAELTVIRVTASPQTIERRLRARDTGAVLEEHLAESASMAAVVDRAAEDSVVVSNDDRPIRGVSLEVLSLLGWL